MPIEILVLGRGYFVVLGGKSRFYFMGTAIFPKDFVEELRVKNAAKDSLELC